MEARGRQAPNVGREPHLSSSCGASRREPGFTTAVGYVNRNNQTVLRATGLPGTDHLQYVYVLGCGRCGEQYGANGSDVHVRRCPSCDGGRPGLPFS